MPHTPKPIVTFNTNRAYSHHGQRIAIFAHHDALVFRDFDRHVDGFVVTGRDDADSLEPGEARALVMHSYDYGTYRPTTQAMDALLPRDPEGLEFPNAVMDRKVVCYG